MDAKQCRMARAGLGWTAADLATIANVGTATVARFELGAQVNGDSLDRMAKALVDAGASFTDRSGRIGVTVPKS